jgi:hypothetical protein
MTDAIVGIELCDGRVWYCHRSDLANTTGSYFAARFGGSIPPGDERIDQYGRSVYFIRSDGELFGKHILPYLTKNDPNLPLFSENPSLRRRLRKEALFYALDGLAATLHVTNSFEPNLDCQGVLHWLGTDKGKSEYCNPHATGAVRVGGWVDTLEEIVDMSDYVEDPRLIADTQSARRALVQYRPPIKGLSAGRHMLEASECCEALGCDYSFEKLSVVLDLKTITLRPKAYSLRYDCCEGASDWNFEGSNDGSTWLPLHQARGDPHLVRPTREEIKSLTDLCGDEDFSEREVSEMLLTYVERKHRHTWSIVSTEFYRYFHFIGLGPEHIEGRGHCVHIVGLELFGDVHDV